MCSNLAKLTGACNHSATATRLGSKEHWRPHAAGWWHPPPSNQGPSCWQRSSPLAGHWGLWANLGGPLAHQMSHPALHYAGAPAPWPTIVSLQQVPSGCAQHGWPAWRANPPPTGKKIRTVDELWYDHKELAKKMLNNTSRQFEN